MGSLSFYASIFLRRLHWFLLVATAIATIAVAMALTLPPAYESQTRLIVEAPQIAGSPSEAFSPVEQLQIVQQQLMTRANLLDIAREQEVFGAEQRAMSPDQIVQAMRARTSMRMDTGRGEATLMTISFEAPRPQAAAGVLNSYLDLIQASDARMRTGRAGQNLEFFEVEVDRLSGELDAASERILEFKNANADALPEGLEYRLSERGSLQDRLSQLERDRSALVTQREQLVRVFEATGRTEDLAPDGRSPSERALSEARDALEDALLTFSDTNPRVRQLRARVDTLEARVQAEREAAGGAEPAAEPDTGRTLLDIQLSEIDDRAEAIATQRADIEARIAALTAAIERTPTNAIALEALERDYQNVQSQYNQARSGLASASAGERIEVRNRGQRIAVIDPPAVPTEPTAPNRTMIAGGGTVAGIAAGLGLVVLLEFLNRTARRPEDLVRRLQITPIATIPYIQTRREAAISRALRIALILAILVGVPAMVWAVHLFYLPLDSIADRVMNALGVRW
jgi:polysaccharide chain length determinant protein (PEP-CTERM system associated)